MIKSKNDNHAVEKQLADFTDQILEGTDQGDKEPFSSDPELRALQQTALHLKNAIPKEGLSEAAIQRMRQNIVMEWKQQKHKTNKSFWKRFFFARKPSEQKWQSRHSRRRQSQRVSFATLVLLLFVSIFLMNRVSSAQLAASGQNLNGSLFLACGVLILLGLWFFRRER